MLDAIRTFFTLYWHIVIPVVATLFLAIPVIVYWYEIRYWLMKVRMRFPWLGRIALWVKNPGEREKASEANPKAVGFNNSERELCQSYETYYRDHQPSEANFKRNQDFLGKIDEDGRREKGLGLWALIIVLMLIEASAFGFALAPFALTLATPNTAIAGAFAIGLVISIIGLFLSEFAGRQMYLNSVVNKILSYENMRSGGDMVRTHIVTIDNTHVDDELPHYQQMLNRVKVPKDGEKPAKRFGLIAAYAVFIVGLAVAAFWVRTETLNAQEADLVANPPVVSQAADDFPIATADDFPIPSDMQSMSESVAGKSAQDQIDSLHRASLVTFAVLSGLFVFIQLTSTFLAFIFGFAGTHSRKAWELTHKFSSAADFVRYHASKALSIAHDGQSALGKLQALQINVFRANGTEREELRRDVLNRTFEVYIAEKDCKDAFAEQKSVIDKLGKESRKVIEDYITKTIADLKAAIATDDNVRILQIIKIARPRFNQIKDPALNSYKEQFQGIVDMFGAAVEEDSAAVPAANPIQEAAPTPPPAPVLFVDAAPAEPAPVVQVQKSSAHAFNHNAWGDLTGYLDDDLDYVAGKKGVDVATIHRARKLQLLDKQDA